MRRAGSWSLVSLLVASLWAGGCSLERGGLRAADGGAAPGDADVVRDGRVPTDASPPRDAGPPSDAGAADTGSGSGSDAGTADTGVDACTAAPETCNGADDDCDGVVDEEASGALEWYEDGDGDGFGRDATVRIACESPGASWVDTGGDCDDDAPGVSPDATETCNGVDDDCTGRVDDGPADCPCHHRRRGVDDRSYLFCESTEGWFTAQAFCMGSGYDLAVIGDLAENDWVWSRASSISDSDWWIGLRDVGSDTYEWVDGTVAWSGGRASGFTRFRGDGTPDGSGPCVEMGDDVVGGRAGAWNDVPCSQATRFVCEQP